jgi:hypothetical protein
LIAGGSDGVETRGITGSSSSRASIGSSSSYLKGHANILKKKILIKVQVIKLF